MKKTIALVVTAVMLAVSIFAGMTMAAEKEELVGEWHISKAKQGEMEIDASLLTMMGMDMILTFNEDGTASTSSAGNLLEGTWEMDGETGTLSFENEINFTLVDGNVVIDQDGMTMIFSREAASGVAGVTLAPAVTDAKMEDFNGTWKATVYNFLGIAIPLNSMGVDITLTIEDGSVVFYEKIADFTNSEEVPEPVEAELTSAMQEDGTLLVDLADSDILSQIGMEASGIILTLHEDGKISGTSPEILEGIESMNSMSEEEENTAAEAADEDAAEEIINEDAGEDTVEDTDAGDSEGSSGDSSADSLQMYILFEKAE